MLLSSRHFSNDATPLLLTLNTHFSRFIPLLSPRGHSHALSRLRAIFLIQRAQQMCLIFSPLTIGWIGVDALLMPASLWIPLAFARSLAGVGFLALGFRRTPHKNLPTAYILIGGLFGITLSFLFFSLSLIAGAETPDASLALSTAYLFAPFVLAACIGFFPLTLVESALLLALPMLLYMWSSLSLFSVIQAGVSIYELVWILTLILGTSTLAAMSQTGYIMALFDNTAHDALTGLYVRKIGEGLLDQQFALAQRQGHPFCIMILDIDHFKRVNDRFGHAEGDTVIASLGSMLRDMLRHQDLAVRWGGEEFLLALPNTTKQQAEGLLKRMARHGMCTTPDEEQITVSIGIAERMADQATAWRALVEASDRRLYVAKKPDAIVLSSAILRISGCKKRRTNIRCIFATNTRFMHSGFATTTYSCCIKGELFVNFLQ